jgi:hypothetical protein
LEQSSKSKTLLKIVIAFGAFSILGLVGLMVAGVIFFLSLTSPAHIKSVAATFMTIDDPLPKGFTYTAAYEVAGLPIVQIADEEAETLYTFSATNDPVKNKTDNLSDLSEEDKVDALEARLAVANKGQLTSKATGQLKFANEIMCYSIGHSSVLGPDETVNNSFGALSQSSKTGRYIYLWVQKQSLLQRNGPTMDLPRIKELLSAVKSF